MDNEAIPYRSSVPRQVIDTTTRNTRDEDNYDTLKAVAKTLRESLEGLDKWSAFDLKQLDQLSLGQQVKAHQLAYDMVAPLLDAVETAVARIDNKYKER